MSSQLARVRETIRDASIAKRFTSIAGVEAAGRRIGVPLAVTDGAAYGTEIPLPDGEHLFSVPDPVWRRMFTNLAPDMPVPEGTAFCETWDDVAFAIQALADLREQLELIGSHLSQGAKEAELDNLKKAVLETGRTGDGHISAEGITNASDLSIPGFEFMGDWIEALGKPYLSDWDLDLSVTRGTSHGWPSFVPANDPASDIDLACHAWLAGWLAAEGYSLERFSAAVREQVPQLKIDVCAQLFFRSGPMAKPTPHYGLRPAKDGHLLALGTSTGYFPRERQVFAVPTCVNLLLRPAATRVKVILRQNPSFKHGDAAALASKIASAPHLTFISEDISGFDRSVTRGMQRDLLKHVYARFLSADEARLYDELQGLSVLAPPLATDTAGYMYKRQGMTISGSIFTTNDGTLINSASIAFSVSEALAIPLEEVWSHKGTRWDLLVLGDDCVIGLDTWDDDVRRKYVAARLKSGFKTDLFPGAVFLMTSVNKERASDELAAFGILSRAVSKTFFREDAARSPLVDIFGLYHRWARCSAHPLAPWAWDRCVAQAPGARRLQVGKTLADLKRKVEHPAFVGLLLEEARKTGVKASLRNLLVGMGHGDIIDGLRLAPSAIAFMGGELASIFMADHRTTGTLMVPDSLKMSFQRSRGLWTPYLKSRLSGLSAQQASGYLLKTNQSQTQHG